MKTKTLTIQLNDEQLPSSQWNQKFTSPLPLMPTEMNWS